MTQPGNNDEIIRVVYQSVADYSQLLRETRKAQQETRQLKRDIDGLAGTTTARVRVTADTAQARTELGRVLRDVMVKVKVTVDAAAANAELARVLRNVVITARLVVDSLAARTEIARTLAGLRNLTVKVKVETDGAALAGLAAQLARIRDLVVKVSVTVDDAALARLRATLAGLRNLAVKVSVDVDAAALTRLQARLARVRAKVVVDLDDAGVMAQFRALIARMQTIARVKIKVEIDESAFRRLTVLMGQLIRLRSQLGNPPTPPTPTPPTPNPGGGGGPGKKNGLPDGLTAAAGLITTFVPLLAAAIPLVAVLSIGVGALAGGLLAAGAGAAIFAVGAVGAFAKVTEAVKAYEKSGTLASGPIGQVVDQFEGLKRRYNELQAATQTDVLAVFSRGLSIAVDLLDKVQDLVGKMAKAVDGALGQVQDAINGAGFDKFLDFVGQQAPSAISEFTRGLLGIAGGIGNLIMDFAPLISTFLTGFGDLGQAFQKWAAGLADNPAFQNFIDYAIAETPVVIDLVKDLFTLAGNLVVALAPLGATLLNIAGGAIAFLAALPPGTLRVVALSVLAVAVAIKLLQGAMALQRAYAAFSAFIGALPGRLGAAARSAGAAKIALAGFGAALAIGVAVAVLTNLMQKLAEQQQAAADAARDHTAAVNDLGKALAANGGKLDTKENRAAQYDKLTELTAEGAAGGFLGNGQHKETVAFSDVAKAAGITPEALVTGSLGIDAKVQSLNIGKLETYRRSLLEQAKADGGNNNLEAQADAVGKLIDKYEANSLAVGEAADKAKDFQSATEGSGSASADAAAKYTTQAAAATAVKEALKVDFSSDKSVAAYNAAIAAQQAYTDGKQALVDATDAAAAADRAHTAAVEAQNDAYLAAVQRIKDVQRALRDGVLDERQAKLSDKQAKQRLSDLIADGASADEIEQARIDAERSANALSDLEQDKKPKTDALQKELAAGVDGNKALLTAIQNTKDAAKALETANKQQGEAARKLTDLHLAFQTAAGALGLTEGEVSKLKTKMDKLKDKTVKIVLDTKGADAKLAALLQGQYAIQLMAADPSLSLEDALAAAAKKVPSTDAAKNTPAPALDSGNLNPNVRSGGTSFGNTPKADGGPLFAVTATAGPVWGPGDGTSDSVLAALPVGGPVRLSRGEHIVTDAEVQAAPGGHDYLEAFRAGLRTGRPWLPGRAYGGPLLGPATLSTGYAMDHGDPNRRRRGALLGPAKISTGFAMAGMPAFRSPVAAAVMPAGGSALATMARQGDPVANHRSVTVNVGTITNAVPETASDSLYKQVRKALDGDDT